MCLAVQQIIHLFDTDTDILVTAFQVCAVGKETRRRWSSDVRGRELDSPTLSSLSPLTTVYGTIVSGETLHSGLNDSQSITNVIFL